VRRADEHAGLFLLCFAIVIPELDRQGGPAVTRRIRQVVREFMPLLARDGQVNVNVLTAVLDAINGAGFAQALSSAGGVAWLDSPDRRRRLERIAAVRARVGAVGAGGPGAYGLGEDDLLTMYTDDEERRDGDGDERDGDGDEIALHNMEVAFDSELQRQIARRSPGADRRPRLAKEVQARLGPETVLITYYSGVVPAGNSGLYLTMYTREEVVGGIVDFGIPGMQLAIGERGGITADVLSLGVTAVRKSLLEPPEKGNATEETLSELEHHQSLVPQPVAEVLQRLSRDGKWHLVVQPYGPLHVFPFHLLDVGGRLLADDWAVTQLPALALLDRADGDGPARDVEVASFGIEFRDGIPHGLPEVPGAEDEARAVAAIFGASPHLGAAATEAAMTTALRSARRIHVATHGLHAVSAPSFQRVYLSPDAAHDGVLFAHELLSHDLRGLDLLTLSACETALGRIDIGDNLRGLPANAFIAGASTVVGTLWPVETGAARTFFEALYTEVRGGADKRRAFHRAQLATRKLYPWYCDWGAFCYTGRW
jgi:hypothetical protein